MIKLTDITKYGEVCKRFVGRYKGYKITLNETVLPSNYCLTKGTMSGWYFIVEQSAGVIHSSLKSDKYNTKEECYDAAIAYIDSVY